MHFPNEIMQNASFPSERPNIEQSVEFFAGKIDYFSDLDQEYVMGAGERLRSAGTEFLERYSLGERGNAYALPVGCKPDLLVIEELGSLSDHSELLNSADESQYSKNRWADIFSGDMSGHELLGWSDTQPDSSKCQNIFYFYVPDIGFCCVECLMHFPASTGLNPKSWVQYLFRGIDDAVTKWEHLSVAVYYEFDHRRRAAGAICDLLMADFLATKRPNEDTRKSFVSRLKEVTSFVQPQILRSALERLKPPLSIDNLKAICTYCDVSVANQAALEAVWRDFKSDPPSRRLMRPFADAAFEVATDLTPNSPSAVWEVVNTDILDTGEFASILTVGAAKFHDPSEVLVDVPACIALAPDILEACQWIKQNAQHWREARRLTEQLYEKLGIGSAFP